MCPGSTTRYTPGRRWKQEAGHEVFCNNYVIEGDTLYMLESVGPVSAAAAVGRCRLKPVGI